MPKRQRNEAAYANPREVADFAHELSPSFLECRELGHLWRPHTASVGKGCYERSLKCPRCKTIRHETLSMRGAVLSQHYEYPDGYQTQGLGRIVGTGRDMLRLESMTRSLGKQRLRRIV